ncbi:MAG: hypothetical protein IJ740_18945 [Ruminococcus sp.]|nr:hypothetical protein [Ruminococcus sp.]MBR1752920.1 hypothetical protein [Ruminococcus sp.]
MRLLKRNLSKIHYCLYVNSSPIIDDDGYATGEMDIEYSEPTEFECSVSAATGYAQTEMFGNLENYDKTIITDDMTCPIDEHSVLFVDKEPEFDTDGRPLYDYIVRRVAKSINNIAYAIRKVDIS